MGKKGTTSRDARYPDLDPESAASCEVAEDRSTPADALLALASKPDLHWLVARYLAENPNTPAAALEIVATVGDFQARGRVALHPNCPPDLLVRLAKDKSSWVRGCAADPDLNWDDWDAASPDYLKALAMVGNWQRRVAAASHPNCPVDLLVYLAKDRSSQVREAVANNPNCPADVLSRLAADKSPRVSERVRVTPVLRDFELGTIDLQAALKVLGSSEMGAHAAFTRYRETKEPSLLLLGLALEPPEPSISTRPVVPPVDEDASVPTPNSTMRLIPLKFDSTCRECSTRLTAGAMAWWARGEGVECDPCHSTPSQATALGSAKKAPSPRTEDGRPMRLISLKKPGTCGWCEAPLPEGDEAWWAKGDPLVCQSCASTPTGMHQLTGPARLLAEGFERRNRDCNRELGKAQHAFHDDPYHNSLSSYLGGEWLILEIAAHPDTPDFILWRIATRPGLEQRLISLGMWVPYDPKSYSPSYVWSHANYPSNTTVFFASVVANPSVDDAFCLRLLDWAKEQRNADLCDVLATSENVSSDVRVMAALLKPSGPS